MFSNRKCALKSDQNLSMQRQSGKTSVSFHFCSNYTICVNSGKKEAQQRGKNSQMTWLHWHGPCPKADRKWDMTHGAVH